MHAITRLSLSVGLACGALLASTAWAAEAPATPIKPKVMLITMFAPEAQHWIERLELKQEVRVPGLSAEYPAIRCNTRDVCLLVTGMGQTNAAASTLALALSPKFDLRKSYFLVAGIAGISPKHGTIGTTAWAHYLVEFGTQWELDSRDAPKDWPTGYLGINTKDVCLLVTGMGQTNAAASTLALALSPKFDLRKSYFLVAGIAGISPKYGTIGTTAWAHYLVEFGTQWELDSRDAPKDWPTGYLGINTKGPNEKPPLEQGVERYHEVNRGSGEKVILLP